MTARQAAYDELNTTDVTRRLANAVRIGTIAALDEARALVRVQSGEFLTDWLPWLAMRAGATRTWSAPRPGEQVVLLCPSGDMAQGVVLPAIFQEAHPAPANSMDVEHTIYPDGSTVDYNSKTNTLTVTVASAGNVIINCKQAIVNASDSVKLNTPQTTCTGALLVQGPLSYESGVSGQGNFSASGGTMTHNGVNVGSDHVHSGVRSGASNTGGPV